jgi:hypothetical protein
MEDYEKYEEEKQVVSRPKRLIILCILSFINAVSNVFTSFFSFVFYDFFQSAFANISEDERLSEMMSKSLGDDWEMLMETTASISREYYFFNTVLYIASFVGVLMMLRLNKNGFHVYTISQILMLIVTSVYVTSKIGGFPLGPVLWTAFFVMMYYSHYKRDMR